MAKVRSLPLFPLKLVTPAAVAFEGNVEQVTGFDPIGQFGVLADHVNFMTSLVPGRLSVKLADGRSLNYYVSDGLAEVTNGTMTITASDIHELDAVENAAVALKAAQETLGQIEAKRAAAERALQTARTRSQASEQRHTPH
jgi:F-type H+-transporting ATPase subunit epsilon